MNAPSNKMVKHTSIYMIGDIVRHSVSIIMLPIYTRYLTPEDYGTIELLSMLIDFATIIFGARVGQAVFRFYCRATLEHEKKSVIASALFLGFIFNGLGSIVIILLAEPLAVAIFSDPSLKYVIALFSITMFLIPLSQVPLTYLRARQKPWLFLVFSFLRLILQLSLNIYFVVHLELHVEGVIYSAVISGTVMAIILLFYTIRRVGFAVQLNMCKKLLSFSIPLKLASIGTFYLTFGDRYVLNMFWDLSQVGIYALAYRFGFIFTLLAWTPFEKMWDAEKYSIVEMKNAKAVYQRTFLYTSTYLIFLGLCISLFSKDLLKVMSDPAFHSASEIIPIIILAYILQAWTKFCNLGILLERKTIYITYSETIAAVFITIAYFSLIPAFGTFGAAWATVIGFYSRFYWTNRKAKEYYDMELPWKKVLLLLAIASSLFFISLLVPENILLSILLRSLLVIIFISFIFISPLLSQEEKNEILSVIRNLTLPLRNFLTK